MARESPYRIVLSEKEQEQLKEMARSYTSPYWQVVRAKLVLLAAQGLRNKQIATRLDMPRQIVSKWRKRFFEEGLAALKDRCRPGRPRVFSP